MKKYCSLFLLLLATNMFSQMPENVSNHCDFIYQRVFLNRNADIAAKTLDSFIQNNGFSKEDFSQELCTLVEGCNFHAYKEGERFKCYLLNRIGQYGTTNAASTLQTALYSGNFRIQRRAAVAYIRIHDYSDDSFETIYPYLKEYFVCLSVCSHIDDYSVEKSIDKEAKLRMISFLKRMTKDTQYCHTLIDKILCRECPDYPNSDLRKEMFARLNLPIPGTEQVASEPSPSHPDSHHGWLKRSLLVGIPILFVGGVLYWKRKQRFSKS